MSGETAIATTVKIAIAVIAIVNTAEMARSSRFSMLTTKIGTSVAVRMPPSNSS